MAKTVGGMDDNGRIYTHKPTRHQRKSEARLIPWTEGPTTKRAKIARALWG
jgi:hypothetical protein